MFLVGVALLCGACGDSGLGACDKQPDVSGTWTFTLTPAAVDMGVTLPRGDTLHATLQQVKPDGVLSLGRLIQGSLTSTDAGFFSSLTIPALTHNDGSKTGSLLGCSISINIPVATPVTDDDVDQGPLKIALFGTITAQGMMVGDPTRSKLILDEDPDHLQRAFAWVGTQP